MGGCINGTLWDLNKGCGSSATRFGFTATPVAGEEDADVITATITVLDGLGQPVTYPVFLNAWLSDAATGIGVAVTAPDSGVGEEGTGAIIFNDLNKVLQLVTDANGVVKITIEESANKTFYLVVVQPNGTLLIETLDFDA